MFTTLLSSLWFIQKYFSYSRRGSNIFPACASCDCYLGFGWVAGVRVGKKTVLLMSCRWFLVGICIGGMSKSGWFLAQLLGVYRVLWRSASGLLVDLVCMSVLVQGCRRNYWPSWPILLAFVLRF